MGYRDWGELSTYYPGCGEPSSDADGISIQMSEISSLSLVFANGARSAHTRTQQGVFSILTHPNPLDEF